MSNNAEQPEKEYAPHQQRVIDEARELRVKTLALQKFIENEDKNSIFKQQTEYERIDLFNQYKTMIEYLAILDRRINRFW